MASSRKTQVLDALLARLATITPLNGCTRQVRSVHRSAAGLPAMAQMDAVCILSADVSNSYLASKVMATLTVTLLAVVEARTDLAEAVDAIEADIEMAIAADPSLGGVAVDSQVRASREAVSEELEGLGGSVLEIVVTYRHALGDPYTA